MPPKGWKTVDIPEYLYEQIKDEWKNNEKELRKKYGVHSFTGYLAEMVSESFMYDTGAVLPKHLNPLIDPALMEDLDDFVEANQSELRKRLKIGSIRQFVEEAVRLHLDYSRRIIERINEEGKPSEL